MRETGRDPRYTEENPEYRRVYRESMEELRGLGVNSHEQMRGLALVRRAGIMMMRPGFQGRTVPLVAQVTAVRKFMEDRINE